MVLAEALLRIPDAGTMDALIADNWSPATGNTPGEKTAPCLSTRPPGDDVNR